MKKYALTLVIIGWGGVAAAGEIELSDGLLRIPEVGHLSDRSLWARGDKLVLVLPGSAPIANQTVEGIGGEIKRVITRRRQGHREVVIELRERAESLLARVNLEADGEDLVFSLVPSEAELAAIAPPKESGTPAGPSEGMGGVPAPSPRSLSKAEAAAKAAKGLAGGKATPSWLEEHKTKRESKNGSFPVWLLVVVGMGITGAALWKKKKGMGRLGFSDPHIDVVSSRALSNKHRLVLVEAGGELLLLGCTDKGVELLRAVDRDRFQSRQEQDFFAEGSRLEASQGPAEPSVDPSPESPVLPDGAPSAANRWRGAAAWAEAAGSGRDEGTDRSRDSARTFLHRLGEQMQQRQGTSKGSAGAGIAVTMAAGSGVGRAAPTGENAPLDESWAARILQLRRARRNGMGGSNGALGGSQLGTWH